MKMFIAVFVSTEYKVHVYIVASSHTDQQDDFLLGKLTVLKENRKGSLRSCNIINIVKQYRQHRNFVMDI